MPKITADNVSLPTSCAPDSVELRAAEYASEISQWGCSVGVCTDEVADDGIVGSAPVGDDNASPVSTDEVSLTRCRPSHGIARCPALDNYTPSGVSQRVHTTDVRTNVVACDDVAHYPLSKDVNPLLLVATDDVAFAGFLPTYPVVRSPDRNACAITERDCAAGICSEEVANDRVVRTSKIDAGAIPAEDIALSRRTCSLRSVSSDDTVPTTDAYAATAKAENLQSLHCVVVRIDHQAIDLP